MAIVRGIITLICYLTSYSWPLLGRRDGPHLKGSSPNRENVLTSFAYLNLELLLAVEHFNRNIIVYNF